MKRQFVALALLVGIALLAAPACASHAKPNHETQDVLLAVQSLGLLANGIEATAEAGTITIAEAHQGLDIINAGVMTLKATNSGAKATLSKALEEIGKLPYAAKIKVYLDTANIVLQQVSGAATIDVTEIIAIGQAFLPGLLAFIRKRREAGLADPTEEELKAHIAAEADAVAADINLWKAAHPVPASAGGYPPGA